MTREQIKVMAKVRFNDGFAYVLNRHSNLLYTKIDEETIIGEDEGMLQFYKRGYCSPTWQAFAGRKFEIPLSDGTVEKCYGQWWDEMSEAARELFDPKDLCDFTFGTIDELRKCYVYVGCRAVRKWVEKLDSEYNGKIYGYWDFEKLIKDKI